VWLKIYGREFHSTQHSNYGTVMNYERLTDDNFLIYCARYYDNPQCYSTEEFIEDLKRIRYIKKLLTRYIENGDLKERLILNHVIVLCNVFTAEHLCRILYLKMKLQFKYVKPFLILLNIMPDRIYNIKDEENIDLNMIPMDERIIESLRKL
jgi:hypothetical protein